MTPARPSRAPERLTSARLAYRRPTADDARDVFERYASDEVATRFMSFPRHRSVEDARAFIASSDAQWDGSGIGPYLLFARDSTALIGSTGLHAGEQPDEAITGYILAPAAWGRGFATEATLRMIALARELGYKALRAPCHPDNAASRRVLEKCGFVVTERVPFAFPNLGGGPVETPVHRIAL